MVKVKEHLKDGIDILELSNEQISVEVTNFGCTILKIIVKDKKNQPCDCVLGFQGIEDYQKRDGSYLGALVGRVCNRIEKGSFELNGDNYQVPINNGPNSLHGGIEGFSYKVFDYEMIEEGIKFHYVSKDGEEGYPGNLDFYAIYYIEGSSLCIQYAGITDKDTLVNITNHSYFNLNGKPSNIDGHTLQIFADQYGQVDADGLFTGKIVNVENTAFDYREERRIGEQIHGQDEQLICAKGIDHPFLFTKESSQVILYSEQTGIELTVSTSYPSAQIYTANYLDGQKDKYGNTMHAQDAICIETSYLADSIHKEENSKTILRVGECYNEQTIYTFGVRK